MSGVQSATTSEAYAQFGKWLIEQPYWLQDAAWRIYSGKEIDDAQIKLYAEMCVAQAKGETPAIPDVTTTTAVIGETARASVVAKCIGIIITTAGTCSPAAIFGIRLANDINGALPERVMTPTY